MRRFATGNARLALAAAALAAIAAAIAGEAPRDAAIGAGVADDALASSRGVLFRLEKDGVAPSFVFGTIHSSDPRVAAVPAAVASAMARARTIASEIRMGEGDVATFFAGALMDGDRRIAEFFAPDTLAAIHAALGESGIPDATIDRLKPWALLLKLSEASRASDPGAATLDQRLQALARSRGMNAIGLELPDEQQAAFDTIPLASQVALVRFVLAHREVLVRDHELVIAAWLDRDLARLLDLASEPGRRNPEIAADFAALRAHLVFGRSAVMAHRLFLPLRHGGVFVAVGALHLPGDKGLLALLAEQGYRVRREY